jgi:hypothetical protein
LVRASRGGQFEESYAWCTVLGDIKLYAS